MTLWLVTRLIACTYMVAILPPQEMLNSIDQDYFNVDVGKEKQRSYLYRLFRPQVTESDAKYPIVVWLHGYGEIEFEDIGDGHLHHTNLVFESLDSLGSLDFYLLALQCPTDQRGFFGIKSVVDSHSGEVYDVPEPGEVVMRVLETLLASESIDRNRITLVGISGAGTDCIEMAMRYPDTFAGISIFGSPGCDEFRQSNLANTPIWAFHTAEDLDIAPAGIMRCSEFLRENGVTLELTMIKGNYHDCWTPAFRDYALLDWLLSQDRESAFSRSPGAMPWSLRRSLMQVGIPLLMLLSIIAEIRRNWLK